VFRSRTKVGGTCKIHVDEKKFSRKHKESRPLYHSGSVDVDMRIKMSCGKIGVGWIKLPQNRVTSCAFSLDDEFSRFPKKKKTGNFLIS
jgi:hypothetical protein